MTGTLAAVRPVLIAVAFALALPSVALGHGGGSQHGYVSSVERIVNDNGVEAVASGDGHFSFTAPAGKTVIVHGYSNEPYLRFHKGAIEVNDLAPTTYANDEQAAPSRADPKAAPVWRNVGEGLTHTWEDHRTHWMGSEPPGGRAPRAGVGPPHLRLARDRHGEDGKPFAIEGELEWSPKKSGPGYEWISFLAIGVGALYVIYLVISRRRSPPGRPPRDDAPARD